MLPRKLHLEQINRFHDTYEKLDTDIQNKIDEVADVHDDELYQLMKIWRDMIKIWEKMDDFIEYDIKHELDCNIKV